MPERSSDWLKQAEKDLTHAKNSLKSNDYEWACFASQQVAEKGLKAVYEKLNRSARGHSIVGLVNGLSAIYDVPKNFYPVREYPAACRGVIPYSTNTGSNTPCEVSNGIYFSCTNIEQILH